MRIRHEREFIEAVSKVSSYHLRTKTGNEMSPLEIKAIANKIDVIKMITSSSDSAYKHRELLLELVEKLGFQQDDFAKIEVLGIVLESAMNAMDHDEAVSICDQILEDTMRLEQKIKRNDITKPVSCKVARIRHISWAACRDLGLHSDFGTVPSRMRYLARALDLCPADSISELLLDWRKVEDGQVRLVEAARHRHSAKIPEPVGTKKSTTHRRTGSASSSESLISTTTRSQLMGSRTAARAARTINSFAHDITKTGFSLRPLSAGSRPASAEGYRRPSSIASSEGDAGPDPNVADLEIRRQARKALVKGVGWLLGTDEEPKV